MKKNGTKKKGKSLFSKIVAWIHLWPSIVSGIILVFVCLTGTLIVYCDEIMEFTAGDAKYITAQPQSQRIVSSQIFEKLEQQHKGYAISEFVFYKDPARSIRLRVYSPTEEKLAMAYMDPYTGKVLKLDKTANFFFVTAHLHSQFLAGPIGGWIVAIATIIFCISCITGLILWWPKRWNKTTRNASFTIRWKARFKRLNYDLHNVYGFYSLLICLVLGITGLIIFFEPLMKTTIRATGGELIHLTEILPKADSTKAGLDMVPFAYQVLQKEHPDKKSVNIWNYERQKIGAYVFTSGTIGLKSIAKAEIIAYDRYTGQQIQLPKGIRQHEKTENIVWQLHMGQWWGQLGKLSTFLAGVIGTTLPITGFLIWWGRRKKKKKPLIKEVPVSTIRKKQLINEL